MPSGPSNRQRNLVQTIAKEMSKMWLRCCDRLMLFCMFLTLLKSWTCQSLEYNLPIRLRNYIKIYKLLFTMDSNSAFILQIMFVYGILILSGGLIGCLMFLWMLRIVMGIKTYGSCYMKIRYQFRNEVIQFDTLDQIYALFLLLIFFILIIIKCHQKQCQRKRWLMLMTGSNMGVIMVQLVFIKCHINSIAFGFKEKMSSAGNTQFTLGHYRIGKSIGEGTFGKVRLGVHIPTDQKVAVKTLQKQKIVQQADIERVTRQICILKILRHPNIIQLYQILQTKTDIHLIMEYAEGGELFDYIVKKKRLDELQSIGFMQQILSGVEYIHKNGIVHRDLKPQNLLLDQNKQIKIVDFGLSNQYKPGQKLKTACGSPCYAAPEMIAGKRYQCLNADIWSCGIILYAMLCGYLPFQDANTNKLYKKIMAGEYQTPKILSSDSKQILKCILNVNPENRFKIQQIRASKWYNLGGKKLMVGGVIVGKDLIQVNEKLVQYMVKQGMDPAQIKNYVSNNRHNHITAFYYLLKKKMEREPTFLKEETQRPTTTEPSSIRRSDSPLIYRPDQKRQYYIPQKKSVGKDVLDSSKHNDSFNVSNIITSLVQANKGKLISANGQGNKIVKKQDNFDKLQEFKLFPNKRNSSIYQNTPTNSKTLTSRSATEDKSFQFSINKTNLQPGDRFSIKTVGKEPSQPHNQIQAPQSKEQNPNLNKKRQELSDQLKQISNKIDKQIHQLRKQNNIGTTSITPNSSSIKKRDSIDATQLPSNLSFKTETVVVPNLNMSENTNKLRESGQSFGGFKAKQRTVQPQTTRGPKIHSGPFNTKCMFMQSPQTLISKITHYLNNLKIKYQQIDDYSLHLSEYQQVSIEYIQGVVGFCIVKFSAISSLNEGIVQFLNK